MEKNTFKNLVVFLSVFFASETFSQELKTIEVNPAQEMKKLLSEVDKDKDQKITVEDKFLGKYYLQDKSGKKYEVQGTYPLSNLLQELTLARENNGKINAEKIYENPVLRISRTIKEVFWDGLTRKIDKNHLEKVLPDSKTKSGGKQYLYIPYNDTVALAYYQKVANDMPSLKMEVVRLPADITPEYVQGLKGKHGLLSLDLKKNNKGELEGVPFVVPGGRFNEMYGWDSYFEALGLLADGRVDLAQAMVDNFVYQITHYGKILNANRTYYLTRSQPPFLTSMIRAVYERLPRNSETKSWLETSLTAAIKEYKTVWMGKDRLTITGLSRYFGAGRGIPPEVEEGHFDPILKPYAKKHKLPVKKFEALYSTGKIKEPELDKFFLHDRAVRESGHDTTYRWRQNSKDICSDFVTVDLNSLLYKTELDLALIIKDEFKGEFRGERSTFYSEKAKERKQLIRKYLWDEKFNVFFDYNWVKGERSDYMSATTFYPLWAFDKKNPSSKILTDEEAKKMVELSLSKLEAKGGVTSTDLASLKKYGDPTHPRQWDYPNGWAPHQMIIWEGLKNYGLESTANRLIYKWLYMITRNAVNYNGTVPEKFDVVRVTHAVFDEYGNVGTDFDYITKEGFGWMNASYQVGLRDIDQKFRGKLEKMVPPEWVHFEIK